MVTEDEIYEVSEAPEEVSASEEISAPEEVFTPEVSPEPVEADSPPDPVPAPEPDPVDPPAPVEVVTVDDLLDRLAGESQENTQTEEPIQTEGPPSAEEEPADPDFVNDLNPAIVSTESIEVVGMDKVLNRLETIQQQTADHPMLTTSFEDYTVMEGLLLLLFLSVVVAACVKMLKGGFAWLR